MHLFLLASLLSAAAPPVRTASNGPVYTDTSFISLSAASPMMRFSQSADLCALLAGDAGAGFGANPAVLGWTEPSGLAYSGRFASRMPELNLPSLYDFSQSFAWTAIGGPRGRLGAGFGMRTMALGPEGSVTEYSLGFGRRMDEYGSITQDLGLSLKALVPEGLGTTDGTTSSTGLMADFGYLLAVGGFLRAAAVLENLGRGADGVRPVLVLASSRNGSQAAWLSYLEDPEYSLTPLTVSLAAALFHSWNAGSFQILDASLAASWSKRPGEGPSNQSFTTVAFHSTLLRSLGSQLGIIRDPSSAELQGKFGVSLDLFNHVRITYAAIGATGGMELSDAQKGWSLSLSNLLRWQRGDLTWWQSAP